MDIKDTITQVLREEFPGFTGVIQGENTVEEPLRIYGNIQADKPNETMEVNAFVEDAHLHEMDGYSCTYWSEAAGKLQRYKDVVFKLISAGAVNFYIRIIGD